MLKLQFKDSSKSVWLIGPVMKVGSAKTNALIVSGEGIEPLHCQIHIDGIRLELEAVGDSETYLNEEKVKGRIPMKLGDTMRLGLQEFEVIDPKKKTAATNNQEQKPASAEETVFRMPAAGGASSNQVSGWMLQGLHKNLRNKRYPIDGTMTLGRSQECDLHFSYDRLSRKHAEFKVRDGVLMIKDLNSSNGTYHNGDKIKQAKLHGGDTVSFDKLEFTVIAPASASSGGEGEMSQTVVRSAITPDMIKAAGKGKTDAKAKPKADETKKKASMAGTLMIVAGVLLLAAGGVFFFFM